MNVPPQSLLGAITPKAQKLHGDLAAWLYREHPHADPLVVISALCYHLGFVAARECHAPLTRDEINELVQQIATVMEFHITESLRERGLVRS
jgi:hypothetical protein